MQCGYDYCVTMIGLEITAITAAAAAVMIETGAEGATSVEAVVVKVGDAVVIQNTIVVVVK